MSETETQKQEKREKNGCALPLLIAGMLLWGALVPPVATLVIQQGLAPAAGSMTQALGRLAAGVLLLLLPWVGIAFFTRREAAWRSVRMTAIALTGVAGYWLVGALLTAFASSDYARGAALLVYAGVATRALLRWAGISLREAGLFHFEGETVASTLILVGLLTFPWPYTGALGDRFETLHITIQTLLEIIPHGLLIWGVGFYLLTSSYGTTQWAALVTLLLYAILLGGEVLAGQGVGAIARGWIALPLAFLLTELRARDKGLLPVLLLLFAYVLAPRIFVDPRDMEAQGFPELQHILSYIGLWLMAGSLGLMLYLARLFRSSYAGDLSLPRWINPTVTIGGAAVMWGVWIGVYIFAGAPGFYDDGFLIIMEEQADLGAAYDYESADLADGADGIKAREERLDYVYRTLVETAERTQAPIREDLDALGFDYRPYYLINMIRVDGHRTWRRSFEGRPDVAAVILNPNVREYPRRLPLPYGMDEPTGVVTDSLTLQENLLAIGVDAAWEMDVTGAGIVVAGQDTGYDWEHPALKASYRGWDGQTATHVYNWHDAWSDAAAPFDDDKHGTHTMGTVLGREGASNRIGVAPDAQWIGCRNMRRGFGNPASYTECMEFFLAPYPLGGDSFVDGDVSRAPHLVNNSWGCPEIEGCFAGTLRPAVDALRAAGVMMVVSAGNEGPGCGTVATPPANYDAAFSVGATSSTSDEITAFSSRGPADGLLKPDISAPGARVRSSVPGGGYGYADGTSMAGPHVAGVAALVWSANPALIGDIARTEQLLCETAVPQPVSETCSPEEAPVDDPFALLEAPVCACGDATGALNNVYGCGIVDAEAAVRAALAEADVDVEE
ncbi:MAG: S8 family serine peptidase [Anaerolineales bacterium]